MNREAAAGAEQHTRSSRTRQRNSVESSKGWKKQSWRSHLGRVLRGLVVPVLVVRDPWDAAVEILDLHRALCVQLCKLLRQVLFDLRTDVVGLLWGHQTAHRHSVSGAQGGQNRTDRKLNFPPTLAGITVFAPTPEKAPSMPWMDSDGLRIRAMITVALSSETAM